MQAAALFWRLMRGVPERSLRAEYRQRMLKFLKHRQNPGLVLLHALKTAMHYHAHTMARQQAAGERRIVNSF
jgi:hypothetical protein